MTVGRFAPSPSGRMHLGNVFTALLAWLSVRSQGGEMLLRIEDLDPERSKGEYIEALRDVQLHWKGSRNQRVIDVKKTLAAGRVILWD